MDNKIKKYLPALCPLSAILILLIAEVFFFSTDNSLFTTYFTSSVLAQHILVFAPFAVNLFAVLLLTSEKFNARLIVCIALFFEALACLGDAIGFDYPIHGSVVEHNLQNYGFNRYYLLACLLTLGLILIVVLLEARLATHAYALLNVFYFVLALIRYTSDMVINSNMSSIAIYNIIFAIAWTINYCSLFYMGMRLNKKNKTPALKFLYRIYSDCYADENCAPISTLRELAKKLSVIAYTDENKEELANALSILSEAANEVRSGNLLRIHADNELKYSLYTLGTEAKKLNEEGIVDERLADLLLTGVDREGSDFRLYALRVANNMFINKKSSEN